jgi:hypothetical protein
MTNAEIASSIRYHQNCADGWASRGNTSEQIHHLGQRNHFIAQLRDRGFDMPSPYLFGVVSITAAVDAAVALIDAESSLGMRMAAE